MSESTDWFQTDVINCPKCKDWTVEYRIVTSSCGGYDDDHCRCTSCKHEWWIEGPDA